MRRQSQYDGTTDASPPSAGSGHMDPYGYGTNVEENGNGYFTNQANGLPSPAQLRSEKSFSLKGSYDRRDSISDEEETPARRQEDDVTHKLKRRQPQVAEAYRYAFTLSRLRHYTNGSVAAGGKLFCGS